MKKCRQFSQVFDLLGRGGDKNGQEMPVMPPHAPLHYFNLIAHFSDNDIKALIHHAPLPDMIKALHLAGDDIKLLFCHNLSPQIWADVVGQMRDVSGYAIGDIEKAQSYMGRLVHDLINKGKIKRPLCN